MKKTILISVVSILLGFLNVNAQDSKKVNNDSEVTLNVKMDCNNCAEKVKKQLAFTKGVKNVSTDLEKQKVVVKYRNDKTDTDKLINSLSEIGYTATVAVSGCANAQKSKACCSGHKEGECSKNKKE
jgi:copper chaperone CopZ